MTTRPAPAPHSPVWAVSMTTIAFLIIGTVLAAMVWPMVRYEVAPGHADLVAPRLTISGNGLTLYEPTKSLRFVTALGNELTPLQAFMGWVDPVVMVQTCEERFGTCDPSQNREVQLGAMSTAKEIASYAAATYLGLSASFELGPVQVGGFDTATCGADAPELAACKVLKIGDTLTSIELDGVGGDGAVKVNIVDDLVKELAKAQPGDEAKLTVRSLGSDVEHDVTVELVKNSDGRTIVGFMARDTRTVALPFAVNIDTDRIGGPSAGLAFTLALIDELTPGDLVPASGAAVTGTISEDGKVGAIGALTQKATAVKKAGAKLFLVPAAQSEAEIAAARAAVGAALEIVPVKTVDEAVEVLVAHGGVAPERKS